MLRKCILIGILALFPAGELLQVVAGMFAAFLFQCLYGQLKPYRSESDDTIAFLGLTEICLTFFVSLCLQQADTGTDNTLDTSTGINSEYLMGCILVLVCTVLPAMAVCLIVLELKGADPSESEKIDLLKRLQGLQLTNEEITTLLQLTNEEITTLNSVVKVNDDCRIL